jgi:hypothetical protein
MLRTFFPFSLFVRVCVCLLLSSPPWIQTKTRLASYAPTLNSPRVRAGSLRRGFSFLVYFPFSSSYPFRLPRQTSRNFLDEEGCSISSTPLVCLPPWSRNYYSFLPFSFRLNTILRSRTCETHTMTHKKGANPQGKNHTNTEGHQKTRISRNISFLRFTLYFINIFTDLDPNSMLPSFSVSPLQPLSFYLFSSYS